MAKKPKASQNKTKDVETKAREEKILAQIGQLALEREELQVRFQQNTQRIITLKQQLAKLRN